jgi:hypothetical protein
MKVHDVTSNLMCSERTDYSSHSSDRCGVWAKMVDHHLLFRQTAGRIGARRDSASGKHKTDATINATA